MAFISFLQVAGFDSANPSCVDNISISLPAACRTIIFSEINSPLPTLRTAWLWRPWPASRSLCVPRAASSTAAPLLPLLDCSFPLTVLTCPCAGLQSLPLAQVKVDGQDVYLVDSAGNAAKVETADVSVNGGMGGEWAGRVACDAWG